MFVVEIISGNQIAGVTLIIRLFAPKRFHFFKQKKLKYTVMDFKITLRLFSVSRQPFV